MADSPSPPATVVNISRVRGEFDVYIGRACARAKDARCHKDSVWANPFVVARASVGGLEIDFALSAYESMLRDRMKRDPNGFRRSLRALRGKRLGCWCKPAACHGDVIVRLMREVLGDG